MMRIRVGKKERNRKNGGKRAKHRQERGRMKKSMK
jgi:hypothetical protein